MSVTLVHKDMQVHKVFQDPWVIGDLEAIKEQRALQVLSVILAVLDTQDQLVTADRLGILVVLDIQVVQVIPDQRVTKVTLVAPHLIITLAVLLHHQILDLVTLHLVTQHFQMLQHFTSINLIWLVQTRTTIYK